MKVHVKASSDVRRELRRKLYKDVQEVVTDLEVMDNETFDNLNLKGFYKDMLDFLQDYHQDLNK